jgi:hypothetical protein
MDGLIMSVPLKYKDTRTFVVGRVILHNDRGGESGQDVVDEKIIVCQLYAAGETRAMRDERERRDERDGGGFEVLNSRFSELRTPNFELRIAPFPLVPLVPLVPPVSLRSGLAMTFRLC